MGRKKEKRKPTDKDWQKIKALYLSGVKPRHIIDKFSELKLTAKTISNRFTADNTKENKDKIKERVEAQLIEDIAAAQEYANRELIAASQKIINVVKKYLDDEMYLDFTIVSKKGFEKTRADTINTKAFLDITKALCGIQKAQRIALDMDKEVEEKQQTPIININFAEDEGGV